ncbi:MAG: hypothetical protein ABJF86_12990 [Tateyamaria sp.]|uniref:hypothetical protein n=1 Tax=Tateyamaria sp. TaxID=1929288 RepID=UPI00328B0CB6
MTKSVSGSIPEPHPDPAFVAIWNVLNAHSRGADAALRQVRPFGEPMGPNLKKGLVPLAQLPDPEAIVKALEKVVDPSLVWRRQN